MAKNFEEKALMKSVNDFIVVSNKHAENARAIFANVLSYTLRSGRLEVLSRLISGMENGGDKLAFVAGYRKIISLDGIKTMLGDESESFKEISSLMKAAGATQINLYKFTDKDGATHVKDNPLVQAYKAALTSEYKDDESMVAAMLPVFVQSNKQQAARATEEFNAARYLKQVIDTIIRKDGSEEARKIAEGVNNVIKATFGRDAALSETEIKDKISAKETDEDRKTREAMALLQAKGVKFELPKPTVVVDHQPAKSEPANLEERRKA